MTKEPDLAPLPPQPTGVAWPTDAWPTATATSADHVALGDLLDHAFSDPDGDGKGPDDLGPTHAFVAIQGGKLVSEAYADGYGPAQTYPSWSMAKSILQALIGIAVREGKMSIFDRVGAPEWAADDPRAELTIDQLLRMASGLAFDEDYVDGDISDTIAMLFGGGKGDVAGYAANKPLLHPIDTVFNYSSGTSNILARALAVALGDGQAVSAGDFEAFMTRTLFDPIGIRGAIPKFDATGTWIGSSYCFMTARDFAKFGLLYMRGGLWDGTQILPNGWVDYARSQSKVPTGADEFQGYGAHWWLEIAGPNTFSCNGYGGQYIVLVPQKDLILVRHGDSHDVQGDGVKRWIRQVAEAFGDA
ncbi:serine hydrolase [Pyruvatibacter sp.]|uniref:serine hydrolase domain-containing protein n=1 Tax=Pyruvatibacter sp. TaxID=1981328 RepID=UPI0032EC25C0